MRHSFCALLVIVLALPLSGRTAPSTGAGSSKEKGSLVVKLDGKETTVPLQERVSDLEKELSKRTRRTVTVTYLAPNNDPVHAWHELVILGDVAAARKSCSIVINNAAGTEIKRYHLENAWPTKYQAGSAAASGQARVTLTLRYEKSTIAQKSAP
jgi:phage tail-like protein